MALAISKSDAAELVHPSNQPKPDCWITCDESFLPEEHRSYLLYYRQYIRVGCGHIKSILADEEKAGELTSHEFALAHLFLVLISAKWPSTSPHVNYNGMVTRTLAPKIFSMPGLQYPRMVPTGYYKWPKGWDPRRKPTGLRLPDTLGVVPKNTPTNNAEVQPGEYNSFGLLSFGLCRQTFYVFGLCRDDKCPARHSPHTPAELLFLASIGAATYIDRYAKFYVPTSIPDVIRNKGWGRFSSTRFPFTPRI
ncbi:hypothetical protein NX059_004056 [Plenodomus lindquistii]|nr:hypothetical protein NX059_004056 [Plenodomus lindquistii]